LQSEHEYLGDLADVVSDVLAPVLELFLSIFVFVIVPAEVLPADDLPLSLPGDERSSGVTGGGDRRGPEHTELVGDRPQ